MNIRPKLTPNISTYKLAPSKLHTVCIVNLSNWDDVACLEPCQTTMVELLDINCLPKKAPLEMLDRFHLVKSVQIRSYFWSVFSCIQSEYRKIRTRNNSVFGHFSRTVSEYASTLWQVLFITFWVKNSISWKFLLDIPSCSVTAK